MEPAQGGTQVVEANVPLAEMFGYGPTVPSVSQGRASYSMEPQPSHVCGFSDRGMVAQSTG
jgi:translation elongation factor EF-G